MLFFFFLFVVVFRVSSFSLFANIVGRDLRVVFACYFFRTVFLLAMFAIGRHLHRFVW